MRLEGKLLLRSLVLASGSEKASGVTENVYVLAACRLLAWINYYE